MSEPDKPETPYQGAYPGSYPAPPPQPYAGYAPPPAAPKNGLGIASLVIAIVALVFIVGGIVLGVVAVILGFLGWGRARRGEANNGGVAVAGIVLGFLSIIEAVVVIGLVVWGFDRFGGTDYLDCMSRAGSDQEAIQQCADQFRENMEDEFSFTITPTP
jgi:hypothetical protein